MNLGTFARASTLAKLAQQIATVLGDDDHKNMLGSTVAASNADLKDTARKDFGSFLALYTLNDHLNPRFVKVSRTPCGALHGGTAMNEAWSLAA